MTTNRVLKPQSICIIPCFARKIAGLPKTGIYKICNPQYDMLNMDNQKANYSKAANAFKKAFKFLPGGVNSPVRAFGGVDIKPLFIERAAGSKIHDIDGNQYIDYVGSWGPMILGHSHPKVLEAVRAPAEQGN